MPALAFAIVQWSYNERQSARFSSNFSSRRDPASLLGSSDEAAGWKSLRFPAGSIGPTTLAHVSMPRLVDEWVSGIGLRREDYGTHSLRRTKAALIYKQTGNLRAVQILLGHTKIESTVRYLGVDIEDALALAEGTEV